MTENVTFRAVGDKSRLVDRVVAEIEGLIVGSQLNPGDKLPPERELATQLGVSRTVVRGAIHILVAKGLLDSRPGVGTIVQKMTSSSVADALNLLLQTTAEKVTFEHVYQLRYILEVETAGLVAALAKDDDVATLRQIVVDMEAVQHNPRLLAAKDVAFHRTLAEIAGNPLLVIFIDLIRNLMRESSELVIPHISPRQTVLPDHYRIVEEIAAGDEAGARQAMRDHLEHIHDNYQTVSADAGGKLSLN